MASNILDGDVAMITGAGQNIGRAIAMRFAREGASVIVLDIDEGRARSTVSEIEEDGHDAMASITDITSENEVKQAVQSAEERYGPLDILINNAALTDSTPFLELSLEEFKDVMAVNLQGTFLCTREAAKSMRKSESGRIVNIASTSAHWGRPNAIAYSTAKSGILNFTRSAAKALAGDNIRVNTLSPTRTGSPVGKDQERGGTPDSILVNRWGKPTDQANAALFLVSPENDFVTGTELVVDGGTLAGPLSGSSREV